MSRRSVCGPERRSPRLPEIARPQAEEEARVDDAGVGELVADLARAGARGDRDVDGRALGAAERLEEREHAEHEHGEHRDDREPREARAQAPPRRGPRGTSAGGVTTARGSAERRTRRMPIGRSGWSSRAPAGAAGGAGGLGWMRCSGRSRPPPGAGARRGGVARLPVERAAGGVDRSGTARGLAARDLGLGDGDGAGVGAGPDDDDAGGFVPVRRASRSRRARSRSCAERSRSAPGSSRPCLLMWLCVSS